MEAQPILDCLSYVNEQPGMQSRSSAFEVLMLLVDYPPEDRLNLIRFRISRERGEVMALVEWVKKGGASGAIVQLPPGTSGGGECTEWVEWFSQEITPEFQD